MEEVQEVMIIYQLVRSTAHWKLTCCNPLRKFPGCPASWTQGYFLCLNIWTKGMRWITGRTFFQDEVWNSSHGQNWPGETMITPMWSGEDSELVALLERQTSVFSVFIDITDIIDQFNLFCLSFSGLLLILPTDILSLWGKLRVTGLGGTEVCVGPTVIRV